MRRKAVHLIAAIAESARFLAVLFLAYDLGALFDASVSNLLRYAAAPQLLFAAGFFFLWLDPARYGAYRPLLLIGKVASIACFVPLAVTMMGEPRVAAFLVAAVDLGSLAVLILARPSDTASNLGVAGSGPSGAAQGPVQGPGQGPGDIEQVEGL